MDRITEDFHAKRERGIATQLLKFDEPLSPIGAYVPVKKASMFGIFSTIDKELVVPLAYHSAKRLTPPFILMGRISKTGFVYGVFSTVTGDFIIPVEYASIEELGGSYFAIKCMFGEWGVYSTLKKTCVVPMHYQEIRQLDGTLFAVRDANKKWGIYSTVYESQTVPTNYDRVEHFGDDLFTVFEGKRCGIYSAKKRTLLAPVEYVAIEQIDETDFRVWSEYLYQDGFGRPQTARKCGVYRHTDDRGRLVVPLKYHTCDRLGKTFFLVTELPVLGQRWGIYDIRARRIIWKNK